MSAPVDDLDRMLMRLVRALRARGVGDVSHPCEVLELAQDVIPYRLLRREGGFDTNEDYEHALSRLLSGEREYLRGDERMQQALREELASKNPDTALFREFARNHVAISAIGLAAAEGFDESSSPPPPVTTAHPTLPLTASPDRPVHRISAVTAAFADLNLPSATETDMAGTPTRSVTAQTIGGKCRYCSASLPEGRKLVFCPFCGSDLTMTQCPACSTELELGWKFCVTCGRSMAARTDGTPVNSPTQPGS